MMFSPERLASLRKRPLLVSLSLLLLVGCATRPVNPPISQAEPNAGYRFEVRQAQVKNKENLVILAFSGGGTRAAAFSYGGSSSCGVPRSSGRRAIEADCSMKSTSSPGCQEAASRRWHMGCSATSCSRRTSRIS